MAYSNMAQLRMLGFDNDETVVWGGKAIALARRVGDGDTEIHALNNVGSAMAPDRRLPRGHDQAGAEP